MNRREFIRFLPAMPAVALFQLYPPFLPVEPVTLETMAEKVKSIETAGMFLGIKVSNVDVRVKALEHCAADCGIRPALKGDV